MVVGAKALWLYTQETDCKPMRLKQRETEECGMWCG